MCLSYRGTVFFFKSKLNILLLLFTKHDLVKGKVCVMHFCQRINEENIWVKLFIVLKLGIILVSFRRLNWQNMSWSSHSRVKCICRFGGGGNASKPSLNQFLRLTPERCDQKSFRGWEQLVTEMGCAPSKSAVVYSEDKMCRDWDTCSTFVPNLPSFVSPPDKPQRSDESSSGGQTFSNGELFL